MSPRSTFSGHKLGSQTDSRIRTYDVVSPAHTYTHRSRSYPMSYPLEDLYPLSRSPSPAYTEATRMRGETASPPPSIKNFRWYRRWDVRYPAWCNVALSGLRILLIVFAGSALLTILVYTVPKLQTNNTGYEESGPGFDLYKNTRFKECMESSFVGANCSRLADQGSIAFNRTQRDYVDYLKVPNWGMLGEEQLAEWCELASCFKNFTVIPSTPRPIAFKFTTLGTWALVNIALLGALFAFLRYITVAHDAQDCQGPSKFQWLLYVFDVVCQIWWWVAFIKLARRPTFYRGISLFQFWTGFRYLTATRHHPILCRFPYGTRKRKLLILAIFVVAAAQWGASIYTWRVRSQDFAETKCKTPFGPVCQCYDCMTSQIPKLDNDRPGCTVSELCFNSMLLTDFLTLPSPYSLNLEAIPLIMNAMAGFTALNFIVMPFLVRERPGRTFYVTAWTEHFFVVLSTACTILASIKGFKDNGSWAKNR
jgi:hypothetical protein